MNGDVSVMSESESDFRVPKRGQSTGEFSPPLRGGVAARSRKRREASLARADGVVFNLNKILWNWITTPSAPYKEASRYFVDVASTPPRRGGENCGPLRFGNNPERPWVQFPASRKPR